MKKSSYAYLAGLALSAIVFHLASTLGFFGKFINGFAPCAQNIGNSFP